MNPLMAAGGGGLSASDSSTTASGDINGRNNNGGAIHFAPTWQSSIPLLVVGALALTAVYLIKK